MNWKVVGVVCVTYFTLLVVKVATAQATEHELSRSFGQSLERNSSTAFKLPVAVLVFKKNT